MSTTTRRARFLDLTQELMGPVGYILVAASPPLVQSKQEPCSSGATNLTAKSIQASIALAQMPVTELFRTTTSRPIWAE